MARDGTGKPGPGAHLSRAASDALGRRRRGRNLALLAGLVALAVLFYFISIAKMSHSDHPAAHPAPASSTVPATH